MTYVDDSEAVECPRFEADTQDVDGPPAREAGEKTGSLRWEL